jgi:hypothetical protein
MGMLGHAALVRSDRSVFALTQPENPHAGHMTMASGPPAEASR